uniref:Uncharacterized protein n=1 Tax=Chromera velia CCMP2878 TaxID=1169474 RepID=A0A0G4F8Y9_9ALVE|eukprot:Cvel_15829.t1-p1 / transcript=Cvel_15829.t1 / gene=Cvel_15829 / organism=Chromera_velia_CCMP2878 / gene_product=hypothetical protein / transcript_product=hypothetical protein / location=Cvel_scaffold1189:40200-41639(-) / protein_length=480 / sequence_SO=supercontig / SO=protein_coding / is_pseudo=false
MGNIAEKMGHREWIGPFARNDWVSFVPPGASRLVRTSERVVGQVTDVKLSKDGQLHYKVQSAHCMNGRLIPSSDLEKVNFEGLHRGAVVVIKEDHPEADDILNDMKEGRHQPDDITSRVGFVSKIKNGKVFVQFGVLSGTHTSWKEDLIAFCPTDVILISRNDGRYRPPRTETSPFLPGDFMRVPAGHTTSTEWGQLQEHQNLTGVFRGYAQAHSGEVLCVVDFTKADSWRCRVTDLEIDPIANKIDIGSSVKLRPLAPGATLQFGASDDVTEASVGTVMYITYDGRVEIKFPKHPSFTAALNEVQLESEAGEPLEEPLTASDTNSDRVVETSTRTLTPRMTHSPPAPGLRLTEISMEDDDDEDEKRITEMEDVAEKPEEKDKHIETQDKGTTSDIQMEWFSVGCEVELVGLHRAPHLNGCRGRVVKVPEQTQRQAGVPQTDDRFLVSAASSRLAGAGTVVEHLKSVRRENLQLIVEELD